MKVGKTRKMVAVEYGKRCGEVNLSILEDLVIIVIFTHHSNSILSLYKYTVYLLISDCDCKGILEGY